MQRKPNIQHMSNAGPDCLTPSDVFGHLQVRAQDYFFSDTHVVIGEQEVRTAIDGSLVFLDHGRAVTDLFPRVFKNLDEPFEIIRHCFARFESLLAQNKGGLQDSVSPM